VFLLKLFWPGEKIDSFKKQLREKFSVELEKLSFKTIVLGAVIALSSAVIGVLNGTDIEIVLLSFVALLFLPLVLSLLYYSYLLEKRKKKLEKQAPMLLLQASVFPRGTPVSKIISYFARKENGLLGEEFAKAKREINRGASIQEAMQKFREKNKGTVTERLADILVIAYESGECLSDAFRELAEELLDMQAIQSEKKAVLEIERATLLLGAAFIVPFILGILTGLVFDFEFGGIEIAGFASSEQRAELLATAPTAVLLYIIEYALIASLFLGWMDGAPRKAFVYALALLPVSVTVFFLAQGFGL